MMKLKITKLSQKPKNESSIISKENSNGSSSLSPKKPKTEGTKQKKAVNFKALF